MHGQIRSKGQTANPSSPEKCVVKKENVHLKAKLETTEKL